MRKHTKYGAEARQSILEGIKKIVSAVKVTLGPAGRHVVIAQSAIIDYGVRSYPLHVTKDGVTVARSFDLADDLYFEKPGVMLVKEACQKTVDQAGDGTTTCAVLLEALAIHGVEAIKKGENQMDIKRQIDAAVDEVVNSMKAMATPIAGSIEKIRQIATVSANNDSSIGDLIADAFSKIGPDGVIDLEASNSTVTELKLSDGVKINRGWISPFFITDRGRQTCEFNNPFILVYDKRVNHHTQIIKAADMAASEGRPLLVFCEDAEGEGLAFMAINTAQGKFQVCAVRNPGFGDDKKDHIEDICLITGATKVSDLTGTDIRKVEKKQLGSAKKVVVSKDDTVIIEGAGSADDVESAINEQRMNLTRAKNEEEKAPIEKRIARLKGSIAVISVGAATETEMKERLDRFDDAVLATKAAISEGYVPGAATAYVRAAQALSKKNAGEKVLYAALMQPIYQIISNGGGNKKIVEAIIAAGGDMGYNAKSGMIENLVSVGVIDPVKVLRCALQNAASSATMLFTCEASICDSPQ